MKRPTGAFVGALLLGVTTSSLASAEVYWRGDFETGDTEQWNRLLDGSGISIVRDPVQEGDNAGFIHITDAPEHIWPNGLNRVEFAYHPADAHTADGADVYFGWSFYLPRLLTEDGHQIGYWESSSSFRQMMSFPVVGDSIRFVTRQPSNETHWTGQVQAQVWHDLSMHVHWSKDAGVGSVDVWFDGELVVDAATARTLNDDNPMFIQVGILRDTIATEEEIVIDNARETSSVDDLLSFVPGMQPPELLDAGVGGSAGMNSVGGASAGEAGATASAGTSLGGTGAVAQAGSAGSGGVTTTAASPQSGNDSGCNISTRSTTAALSVLGLLSLTALGWRRRKNHAECD